MRRHALIVVGAGPAGAAAALHFLRRRPGASVLLLDKAAFPRDKVCGDAISPDGVAELERLGARSVVDGYAPIARMRVRSPGGVEASGTAPEPGYVVPRQVLDGRLVGLAVAAGAELRQVKVRTVEQDGRAVQVDGRFEASALVGADGASSVVRRRVGVPPNAQGHVGIALRGYAPLGGQEPELYLGWVAAGGPAYAWAFPIRRSPPMDEEVRNVGFGLLASTAATRHLLERGVRRNLDLVAPDAATLRAHHLPMSSGRPCPYRGRVLLAGDAAALVNPLTGEGIFYALLSGRLAAQAALDAPHDPGPRYAALLRHALGRHFRHTGLLARMAAWPWTIDSVVTAARDPAVLQTVGELAFGKGVVTPRVVAHVTAGWLRQRPRPRQ
ncbi:MAG: NAD(P)/FAD-dependent oxidoreductase [Egibacteraceae bacterium]